MRHIDHTHLAKNNCQAECHQQQHAKHGQAVKTLHH